jgi:hypothetical protein
MPGLCGVVDASPHVGSGIDSAIAHLCRYPWHHPAVEAFARGTAGHVAVERTGFPPAPAFARAAHIRVVFDGELYGRDVLAPADCVARGVVAQGRAYFNSVHGSFTCAIWDERAETMTLVTDRYGTRPLFWAADRGRFTFASEVGAVAAMRPRSERSLAGTAEFLAFGQLLGDTTLYEGIRAAPGAAWITFDAVRDHVTVDRYEQLDGAEATRTEHEWLQAIDEALAASVEQCCVTDGSLGSRFRGASMREPSWPSRLGTCGSRVSASASRAASISARRAVWPISRGSRSINTISTKTSWAASNLCSGRWWT